MRSRTRFVVPVKRPNKAVMALGDRVWAAAEGLEGRGCGPRKSGLRRMFRAQHRRKRVTDAGRERIEVTGLTGLTRDHVRPPVGARCGEAARRDLCGGRRVIAVPTAPAALAMTGWELARLFLGVALASPFLRA